VGTAVRHAVVNTTKTAARPDDRPVARQANTTIAAAWSDGTAAMSQSLGSTHALADGDGLTPMSQSLGSAHALADGDGDLFLHVFRQLGCTMALHHASATCRLWHHLLRRGAPGAPGADIWEQSWLTAPVLDGDGNTLLSVDRALRCAPAGSRIRITQGPITSDIHIRPITIEAIGEVTLPSLSFLPSPAKKNSSSPNPQKHVSSRKQVKVHGTLYLQGAAGLVSSTAVGSVRGLHFFHWDTEALVVSGGQWTVDEIQVSSKHGGRRASTSVIVHGGTLHMRGSTIRNCKHGVVLDSTNAACVFTAHGCRFTGCKAAIITRGGGKVTG